MDHFAVRPPPDWATGVWFGDGSAATEGM